MEQKQKLGSHLSLSILENNTTSVLEQDELMKLTKVSKEWDFTCTFCFKKFATAQAMGGHQNAHRNERLEEKRLYVRDPIGYRKRAYLRAMQGVDGESSHQGEGSGEKELDPTAYKKRAYLSEMQAKDVESPRVGDSNSEVIEDAHSKMVNRKFDSMNTPPKTL